MKFWKFGKKKNKLILEDNGDTLYLPALVVLEDKNIITISAWTVTTTKEGDRYAHIFIRDDRYSAELIDDIEYFTISMVPNLKEIMYAGKTSGRDKDKFQRIDTWDYPPTPVSSLVSHTCIIEERKQVPGYIVVSGLIEETSGGTKKYDIWRWFDGKEGE